MIIQCCVLGSLCLIPDFNQKLSTSRSRNINISIVLQSIDQLMDLYKDIYENIKEVEE